MAILTPAKNQGFEMPTFPDQTRNLSPPFSLAPKSYMAMIGTQKTLELTIQDTLEYLSQTTLSETQPVISSFSKRVRAKMA